MANEEITLQKPITAEQKYLYFLAGGDIELGDLPAPRTRTQMYLAVMCGMELDYDIPKPITRDHEYLYTIATTEDDEDEV